MNWTTIHETELESSHYATFNGFNIFLLLGEGNQVIGSMIVNIKSRKTEQYIDDSKTIAWHIKNTTEWISQSV